jgi:hypothetical protein
MIRDKFCLCHGGGFTARLEAPLFPMKIPRDGQSVLFFTAAYKCHKCGTLTLRGETNERQTFTMFSKEITPDELKQLKHQKVQYDLNLERRSHNVGDPTPNSLLSA